MESASLRTLFRWINQFFMVPMFRLGLGSLIGNPLTGYMMVLKTVGNKTGKVRYAPVNYALLDGSIYCLAGWGQVAHWYRNLRARPQVEVLLPGRALFGVAEDVTDPDEAARAAHHVLRNAGFAGFFLGFNPRTATDELVRARLQGLPVIRIRAVGLAAGASDPGGWVWLAVLAIGFWLLRRR